MSRVAALSAAWWGPPPRHAVEGASLFRPTALRACYIDLAVFNFLFQAIEESAVQLEVQVPNTCVELVVLFSFDGFSFSHCLLDFPATPPDQHCPIGNWFPSSWEFILIHWEWISTLPGRARRQDIKKLCFFR